MEVGHTVIVNRNLYGHKFNKGEEVRVILAIGTLYKCISLLTNKVYFVHPKEVLIPNEETVPNEYWSGGFADNH
jgi:hypothetical protein